MASDQSLMLCQEERREAVQTSDHRNVSNWIKALKTLGILRVAVPWSKGRATRYLLPGMSIRQGPTNRTDLSANAG
jgi:hypothetical protein